MGMYVNPGNKSFRTAINSKIYVDKTDMITQLNDMLDTEQNHVCISRARRFGKSMIAGMLDAYYSVGCDSQAVFAPYKLSKCNDYMTHMNKYHVIHFDMTSFMSAAEDENQIISLLKDTLLRDLRSEFPDLLDEQIKHIHFAISDIYQKTKREFVIIIDEWDCIIRNAKENDALITEYLNFLRGLFKSEESKQFLALGYITGILPIKKIKDESALNNFYEFTMTDSGRFASYFGFTQEEVEGLCQSGLMDFDEIAKWYNGYRLGVYQIYNPNSVIEAFFRRKTGCYWKNTSSYEVINDYICRNYSGLKDAVLQMLAGQTYKVDVSTFKNDLMSFSSMDEVLTALIHLGYLGYDEDAGCAFVPNDEVHAAFTSAIKVGEWSDVKEALAHSDQLLKATINGEADVVAKELAESQMDYASIIAFHDENSLSCAIMMAYYTAREKYTIIREFPTGKGYADIVFIPKPHCTGPAMIVELKWNHSADTAIRQVKEKRYTGALSSYKENLLLVGINYDKAKKEYECQIEKNVWL